MLLGLGAVATVPFWATRMLRTGKWRTDWAGRFGRCAKLPDTGRPTVLIHAVSVGEVNATRQLVALLQDRLGGDCRIVISATTNTGVRRARDLYEPAHTVIRYPLDFTCCVNRVLDAIQPDVVALIELEVWPNFVEACAKRDVPVCVINGRLSARSFSRYKLIAPALRKTFGRLAAAAVQTNDYAKRFEALGTPASRIAVTDTMKWDTARIAEAGDVEGVVALADDLGIDRSRPLVVAGSTGPGEERMLIDSRPDGVQLLLVPRLPERFDEVALIAPDMVRRTAGIRGQGPGDGRQLPGGGLFLLDTMGELRKAYALANVVIVGRSFGGLHGSDPIEPIALGKPTLIGPHHGDFTDIVSAFRSAGGIEVTSRPMQRAAALLNKPDTCRKMGERGRDVIRARQGATRRHVDLIVGLMRRSN